MKTLILILALCFVTPALAGPKHHKQQRKPSVSQRQRYQKLRRIERKRRGRRIERQRQYRPYYAPRYYPARYYQPPIKIGEGLYYFPDTGRIIFSTRF